MIFLSEGILFNVPFEHTTRCANRISTLSPFTYRSIASALNTLLMFRFVMITLFVVTASADPIATAGTLDNALYPPALYAFPVIPDIHLFTV